VLVVCHLWSCQVVEVRDVEGQSLNVRHAQPPPGHPGPGLAAKAQGLTLWELNIKDGYRMRLVSGGCCHGAEGGP
jgi:hypothetical protein